MSAYPQFAGPAPLFGFRNFRRHFERDAHCGLVVVQPRADRFEHRPSAANRRRTGLVWNVDQKAAIFFADSKNSRAAAATLSAK
jgi:hypothetical protein